MTTPSTQTRQPANGALDLEVADDSRSLIKHPGVHTRMRSRLNTADFEAKIAHYPDEAKAAALWLHNYTLNTHHGHHASVAKIARDLGFSVSDNYLYQVTSGIYFRGRVGKTMLANFLELVAALRRHDQLAASAGKIPFVETGTYQDIAAYLDLKRAPDTVCKFGMIAGDTAMQKTESLKQYAVRNNHGAVVRIEAPAHVTLARFLVKLGYCYGISPTTTTSARMIELERCVNSTRTIIIDNAQRLYLPNTGRSQPIFSFLQELQDDTGCTIILSVTNEFPEVMTAGKDRDFFHQFAGRIGGVDKILRLPVNPPKADIIQIAEAFRVADTRAAWPLLKQWSHGPEKLRILFDRLQDARRLANSEGSDAITASHLEAVK